MRALWQRTILAVALGLGVTAGLVRAGEPFASPVTPNGDDQPMPSRVVSEPLVPTTVDGATEYAVEHEPEPQPAASANGQRLSPKADDKHFPLANWWRNHNPILCYSNFNDYSCGGVHSEFLFHFGSCRQFFGERCLKAPPPSIVPGFDPDAYGLNDGHHLHCPFCR
jgi:hypothetical protein